MAMLKKLNQKWWVRDLRYVLFSYEFLFHNDFKYAGKHLT